MLTQYISLFIYLSFSCLSVSHTRARAYTRMDAYPSPLPLPPPPPLPGNAPTDLRPELHVLESASITGPSAILDVPGTLPSPGPHRRLAALAFHATARGRYSAPTSAPCRPSVAGCRPCSSACAGGVWRRRIHASQHCASMTYLRHEVHGECRRWRGQVER